LYLHTSADYWLVSASSKEDAYEMIPDMVASENYRKSQAPDELRAALQRFIIHLKGRLQLFVVVRTAWAPMHFCFRQGPTSMRNRSYDLSRVKSAFFDVVKVVI
jgi:hypothetical protein